jgi:hypothetical protein
MGKFSGAVQSGGGRRENLFSLDRRGLGIVELSVTIAVLALFISFPIMIIRYTADTGRRSQESFWLNARRFEIHATLRSASAWPGIVAANPLLNCYQAGTGCPALYGKIQKLVLPLDPVTLDGNDPKTGMGPDGSFCASFDPAVPDPKCVIGMDLTWEVLCESPLCRQPQPRFAVNFRALQGEDPAWNMKSHDIVVYKDPRLESLNEVCASMGGALTGTACVLPQLASNCDPASGQSVLGFDGTGKVICGRPNFPSCAAGQTIMGFDNTGGVLCAAGCP